MTTGRAFGRYYLAMELVTGGHFEHQIRERGALPEVEVLPLAIQVAEGLQAAHAAGLIHRDVKPGNILLDAAGNAKIVDFGLALVTKGGKAQATEIWATPYYVPPETIEGLEEDFRSDIYAFGATLYHALAGAPSCAEETMDTGKLRQAKQHILPLAQVAPWLTAETCAVVDRAMAYQPGDRFNSYDEMLAALRYAQQRVLAGPAEVQPDAATIRRRRAAKQREKWYMAGAAVLLAAATGTAIHFISKKAPVTLKGSPTADGALAIPQGDPGSHADPVVVARIGRRYKDARDAVEKGDFEQARGEFSALRDDPEIQEPTGSWAGLEAVISAYLDDHPESARREAASSSKHISSANLPNPNVSGILVPALKSIRDLPSIPPTDLDSAKADAPILMAWLLCGLKNWEQGCLEDAHDFFQACESAKLQDSDAWARYYQKVAGRYLADYKRLQDAKIDDLPGDKAGCQKKIDELDKVHASLETRGRARFNVREWQLNLRRQMHDLDAPKLVAGGLLADARPEIDQLCKDFKFNEAVAKIKSLQPAASEKPVCDSLRALGESAATLLADLTTDLGRGEIAVDLKARDGNASYAKIAAADSGKLRVTDIVGSSTDILWKDLAADSIIDLHRVLVRNAPDSEKLRRHESAIAFDWLAGDRDRATGAADRLAAGARPSKSTGTR